MSPGHYIAVDLDNPTKIHKSKYWDFDFTPTFEGNYDDSLSTLTELTVLYPTHQDIRYDLAMTQMMLGMSDEAAENFSEVLRQNPEHEKAKRQLAYFQ